MMKKRNTGNNGTEELGLFHACITRYMLQDLDIDA